MKYEALKTHLARNAARRVSMTFAEVAKVIGKPLPASAYRYPSWWANDAAHHAQARAWAEAGYRTENVDLKEQRVEFVRIEKSITRRAPVKRHPMIGAMKGTFKIDPEKEQLGTERPGVREMQKTYEHQPGPPYKVHPAYGALKGTFTIDPEWDLTNPVFDEDEMAEWEASLERKAKLIAEGLRRKK
jgi:hypothetical protein